MRTRNNNELKLENVNEIVTLIGWVSKKRDLGGLIFIDLRDRYGITQLVVEPDNKFYEEAFKVKSEYIIEVTGKVVERSNKNKNIPTGDIEVLVEEFKTVSTAELTPMIIADNTDALENTRMKYRYLDLRRPIMQNNMRIRHKATIAARNYFDNLDFLEIETPILGKSTPEGARDFLLPSRVFNGSFYALPQSPQMYKQLLMVAGFEKYFQIAKCFRDEDLRADRQLEFTQIDVEMSFVDEEDIYSLIENLLVKIWKDVINVEVKAPFKRIKFEDAMNRFGSDKPDTRFEMELNDISETAKLTDFVVFNNTLANNGKVKAIVAKNAASKYSRKDVDRLVDFVKIHKASGLVWLKYENNTLAGSMNKFLNPEFNESLINELKLENGDMIFMVADSNKVCNNALGNLRLQLAKELDIIDNDKFNFLWVVDWPLFEYDEESQRYVAAHHPFTSPKDEDAKKLLTNPGECIAKAYDIVLNGYELGGGSIRIFNQEMQKDMFTAIGMTDEQIEEQFGFFTNALKYGTPPHGGLALGLDRIIMLLTKNTNLREVIAFPVAASSRYMMTDAPGTVDEKQLDELGIKIKE